MTAIDGGQSVPLQRLDQIAESAFAKLLNRIGTPVFMIIIGIVGWVTVQWIAGIQEKTQVQINILNAQFTELKEDLARRRQENLSVQTNLTTTLTETQKTLAAMQATATAQYHQVQSQIEEMRRQQDRMDDRLNGRPH